jgi:hypothetical protein
MVPEVLVYLKARSQRVGELHLVVVPQDIGDIEEPIAG